jgi:hypothetical protein
VLNACDSYPAESLGNGRRAREVIPAAIRALEMELVAAEIELMAPHTTRKFFALQQLFHEMAVHLRLVFMRLTGSAP